MLEIFGIFHSFQGVVDVTEKSAEDAGFTLCKHFISIAMKISIISSIIAK
jgi:hypothetical protein